MNRHPARWNVVVQALHWLAVVLLLFLAYTGLFRAPAAEGGNLHATLGIALLIVTLLRGAARIIFMDPPHTKTTSAQLAGCVHVLLYLGIFALVLSGLLSVSRSAFSPPVFVFGSISLPTLHWIPARLGSEAHRWSGYGLLTLVLLHVVGIVRHHVLGDKGFVYRMLPFRTGR